MTDADLIMAIDAIALIIAPFIIATLWLTLRR